MKTESREGGVLSIDAGTSGTRAAVLLADGSVAFAAHRALEPRRREGGVVEQDAFDLWRATLDAVCEVATRADGEGTALVAAGLCAQRGSAVLWDRRSGLPYGSVGVWQDQRLAPELAAHEQSWRTRLAERTGRSASTWSPFLWAVRRLEEEVEAAEALRSRRLVFGTIGSWIAWKLTGGVRHGIAATDASSTGGYLLAEHAWYAEWLDVLGFPPELRPPLYDDDAYVGDVLPEHFGKRLPLFAALGDQQAAVLGAGVRENEALCVHGTGSFVSARVPDHIEMGDLQHPPGVTTVVGLRSGGTTRLSQEAYCPSTGSAVRWLCASIQMFASEAEMEALASACNGSTTVRFVPALAGARLPRFDAQASGRLSGLRLETTREQVARAVFEGIAHSVCDAVDALDAARGKRIERLRVCGGLAVSSTLLQIQADLLSVPVERLETGSLTGARGAAILAGVASNRWPSSAWHFASTVEEFEPTIGWGQREEERGAWRSALELESPTSPREGTARSLRGSEVR